MTEGEGPGKPALLGIDPGRSKCGYAAIDAKGGRLALEVVPTGLIAERIAADVSQGAVSAICIGHATTSSAIVRLCAQRWPAIPAVIVDETNTSFEARRLYYDDNPPKGLLRFIPRGLLVPKAALDGYAALLILERYRRSAETLQARGGQGEIVE